ncbi:MAG: linear amide C-N hydrolase [Clostridiales bacterium]|nr:linear amide C-N hydrolase [Clostridiales bacterium]
MSRKRFIFSEIILILAAVLLIAAGSCYRSILSFFTSGTDPNTLGPSDLGKTFSFKCEPYFVEAGEHDFLLNYSDDDGNGLSFYVSVPPELSRRFYTRCINMSGTYQGVLRPAGKDTKQASFAALEDYYTRLAEITGDSTLVSDPEFTESLQECVADYSIELVSLNDAPSSVPKYIIFAAGAILALTFIFRLIARIAKTTALKVAAIALAPVLLVAIVLTVITFNKIRTVASVKNVGPGIYSMNFYADPKTDKLLQSDISTVDDLISWIIDEQLYGLPVTVDESNYGCATFTCTSPDGDTLFGRNYDYRDTDTLVIYTDPKDGYASYALADMTVLGVGEYGIDPLSPSGRAYMLAAPYICLDGVNEKGLAAGILELTIGELHQDNGKPDLLIYCAIRAMLDNCANVDEAVALLSSYDIHSSIGVSYHLHIADGSGRSVVVEWLDGQMAVNELSAATNSVLTPGDHFNEGDPDLRLRILTNTLQSNDGILTEEDARDLLDAVSQQNYTEWSCVYNLNRFEVYVYIDEDYGTPYIFGGT